MGLPAPTYEDVKRAIGGGLPRAMGKFVPADLVDEALAIYRPYWHETMLDGVTLMPGAAEVLRDLKSWACKRRSSPTNMVRRLDAFVITLRYPTCWMM